MLQQQMCKLKNDGKKRHADS